MQNRFTVTALRVDRNRIEANLKLQEQETTSSHIEQSISWLSTSPVAFIQEGYACGFDLCGNV